MAYIELYGDDILETVSLGKVDTDFDTTKGDYIKVEILSKRDVLLQTLYSNKLLLRTQNGNHYFGNYHYHPENGFMEGAVHTDEPHSKLLPILQDASLIGEEYNTFNPNLEYKKQLNIYYDDNNKCYIKPDEILSSVIKGSIADTYKLRIYSMRDLRTTIAGFLTNYKFNLIENGNFFAGLEATQTGDLDRSIGHNRFTRKTNPGLGRFSLEQTGAGNNEYDMMVTGIEPNTDYVFSCWVGYDNNYEGDDSLVQFDSAVQLNEADLQVEEPVVESKTITIRMKGKYYNGWPHCKVLLNGNIMLADLYVETDQYTDYTFDIPDSDLIDENSQLSIGIIFDNDAYNAGIGDRNLYVSSIKGNNNIAYAPSLTNVASEEETLNIGVNGEIVPNSTALYYNLIENGGQLKNTYGDAPFLGQYRGVLAWAGELRIDIPASRMFNFGVAGDPPPNTDGLIVQPNTAVGISTDVFSSYYENSEQTNELGVINRNLQTWSNDGLVWYRRFKLVSTTEEATLGSLRVHLGKTFNVGDTSSSTIGRRYFTDLRFEKVENFNDGLLTYLNKLNNLEM